MSPNAELTTFRIEPDTSIAQVLALSAAPVKLDSQAIEVMTDLTQVKAATTHPGATLDQAEQTMIHQGVRMLFVVTELPSIQGLITLTDLHGDKPMRVVHERNLRHDELCVADVMTALPAIDAIEFDPLRTATVGNLVATLRRVGRNHLLVVQAATAHTPRRVRGVVSRSQIERQLGHPIEVNEVASSFAEIERALL